MRFLDTLRDLDHRAVFGDHDSTPCDACLAATIRDRLWHEARPRLTALVEAVSKAVLSIPPSFFDKSNAPTHPEEAVSYAVDYSHLVNLRATLSALDEGGTP